MQGDNVEVDESLFQDLEDLDTDQAHFLNKMFYVMFVEDSAALVHYLYLKLSRTEQCTFNNKIVAG